MVLKILDATCGPKGIWYQKNHPWVTFMDKRKGTFIGTTPNTKLKNRRKYKVEPDIVSEWKDAPFPDNYFDIMIFDPPHIAKQKEKMDSCLTIEYGRLDKDNWRQELGEGITKLFKILKPEGIFIFKWSECSIKLQDVIKLFPYKPLFGSNTKSKGKTAHFWILFIKHKFEADLMSDYYQDNDIKESG